MNCYDTFNPMKRFVQFNDIVFDSFDMVTSSELKVSTKTKTQEYSYGHGSYVKFPRPSLFLTEQDIGLTVNFIYSKYNKEDRPHLKDFIKSNLMKAGKLWAIEGDRLLWAYAYVTDYSEPYELYKGEMSINIDFKVYEGVWHVADRKKTFLVPYDTCRVFDCGDWQYEDTECDDCCVNCPPQQLGNCSCLCDCDSLGKENTLCAMGKDALHDFLSCKKSFHIAYSCSRANKLWGDEELLGKRLCKADSCLDTIAGKFYSQTVIDTNKVDVTLKGKFQDPTITINDTKVTILGEYDGILKINDSFDVMFTEDECCEYEDVDLDKVVVENDYQFTVHHGENRVIVEGICCHMACVFVHVDELTY